MPRPKIKTNPARRSMNPMTIPMNSKTKTISRKSGSLNRYSVTKPRRTSTTPPASPPVPPPQPPLLYFSLPLPKPRTAQALSYFSPRLLPSSHLDKRGDPPRARVRAPNHSLPVGTLESASLAEEGPLHLTPFPTWVGGQDSRCANSLRHHDGLPELPGLPETELREEMLRPRPEK